MERKNSGTGLIFGIFLTIMVVMMAISIGGCIGGGNGEQESSGIETPPVEETPSDKETPAEEPPEQEEPETEEQETEGLEGEKPGKSFADLLNLGKPQGYVIDYDITGKEMSSVSKMTMYFAGEKKMRMDSLLKDAETTSESSVFIIGDNMHVCTKTDGEWTCITFKGDDTTSELEETTGVFEKDPEKPLYDGTQNIAGITAECYKLESEGTKYRYCIHPKKYLMLLGETRINGELEYKTIATKVDLNMPQDSVFELPADSMDIESMMSDPCAVCDMLSGVDKTQCLEDCTPS